VLRASDIRALTQAIARQDIPHSRAGARHVLKCPPIAALATDPRLLAIASEWLGAPAIPFKATLFDKNPGANWLVAWHQDTALPLVQRSAAAGWGPWSIKDGVNYAHAPATVLDRVIALRIHLDDSFSENGPLRVLPGTHRLGVLSDAQVAELARNAHPSQCCVPAGGVIAMRPLIVHASSKSLSLSSRRVLHVEYAASLEIAPGLTLRAA
jgi:ectoine hydroxylase-related dioxygenase (phytanoyl-CoA dioxygenase family)